MAGILVKLVAKKLMKGPMTKYEDKKVGGPTDPYFTKVVDPRTGKERKVKKQIPDYIPDHDAIILAKMRNRSYKLDMSLFEIAGIRFGWSSIIGLVPAFGDAADALLALSLVWRCSQIECGLGPTVLMTMLINVALDFVIGLIPLLGDLADAAFKANTKNVRVLEKRLDEVYKPNGLKSQDQERQRRVKEDRRRSGMKYDEQYEAPPATVLEEFSDDEHEDRRKFVEQGRAADRREADRNVAGNGVSRAQPTVNHDREPQRSGWFSGFRSGSGQGDVERGDGTAPRPVR